MKSTIGATIIENVVRKGRKQTHFGPKMCTVSKRKRQFDKWHPFHAYTGGGSVCIENPKRGGVSQKGEGPRGWEVWGGGRAKYFFSGPKRPPR